MEITGVLGMSNSIVELKNGSLLSNDGRVSEDGGKTWSEPRYFREGVSGVGIIRLKSEALALTSQVGYEKGMIWLSNDEGQSWDPGSPIRVPGGPVYELGDTMIQLESGRLLYCWDYNMVGRHPEMEYEDILARGIWKGKTYAVEGHGHFPEFFASGFSYSDDEGKTWQYEEPGNMPSVLMGWFDFKGESNGMCGITVCGEASIAQAYDGRVLLFGRSTVGRIVCSYSEDGGIRWSVLKPTELAASNSPPRLRRIPGTRDLLCVWNQVSGEEIRRGFRRSRLSSAISRDNGLSWENFKTIELSEGLEDTGRVEPEPEIRMVRARQDVGKLPDGFAFFHYSNVCFAADKVYLMYNRGYPRMGNAEKVSPEQEKVLRIYPLEWFYN